MKLRIWRVLALTIIDSTSKLTFCARKTHIKMLGNHLEVVVGWLLTEQFEQASDKFDELVVRTT